MSASSEVIINIICTKLRINFEKEKLSISTSKGTSFSEDDNRKVFIDTTKQKMPEIH